MAAPIDALYTLPFDIFTVRKNLRMQTRIVGGNTVFELFAIPISRRSRLGIYYGSSGILSIQAAAHAATAGFWWLINPVGSAVKVALRRIIFEHSAAALAAANTRVTLERITFTGTASAVITPLKRDSNDAANVGLALSASTGITPASVSSNAAIYTSWSPPVITAAGVLTPVQDAFHLYDEDEQGILAAGEGFVVRQPDAGVTTDPRRLVVSVIWEEFE